MHLHLSAQDIANGPVQVVIVEGDGSEVWKSAAKAQKDQVEVSYIAGDAIALLGKRKSEDDTFLQAV